MPAHSRFQPLAHSSLAAAVTACTLLASPPADAISIALTLPELNYFGGPDFPSPEQLVGSFDYIIPAGEQIVSAKLTGSFGNSSYPNSAAVDLSLDGLLVAQCRFLDVCWTSWQRTPWSYVFSDFSLLSDGHAELSSTQTSEFTTRLGATTLSIETAPTAVPGPLASLGAALALGFSRRLRRRITTADPGGACPPHPRDSL